MYIHLSTNNQHITYSIPENNFEIHSSTPDLSNEWWKYGSIQIYGSLRQTQLYGIAVLRLTTYLTLWTIWNLRWNERYYFQTLFLKIEIIFSSVRVYSGKSRKILWPWPIDIGSHDVRWIYTLLQWRHNEGHGVSTHRHLNCMFSRSIRRTPKKTSKLRVTGLCEGGPPVTSVYPQKRPVRAKNVSILWRHHILFFIWVCSRLRIWANAKQVSRLSLQRQSSWDHPNR